MFFVRNGLEQQKQNIFSNPGFDSSLDTMPETLEIEKKICYSLTQHGLSGLNSPISVTSFFEQVVSDLPTM